MAFPLSRFPGNAYLQPRHLTEVALDFLNLTLNGHFPSSYSAGSATVRYCETTCFHATGARLCGSSLVIQGCKASVSLRYTEILGRL